MTKVNALFVTATICLTLAQGAMARADSFADYVAGLRDAAMERGITEEVFNAATKGLKRNGKIVTLTQRQPESTTAIPQYLSKRVTNGLINAGRSHAKKLRSLGSQIEARFGIPFEIVLAIWGVETNYGGYTGRSDTLQSLATLGHARYRDDFFEQQFLDAMVLMQRERVSRAQMRGSWAGAVGQVQFMPSSYLAHAVDFDGDGKRDLWNSLPDALGSAAHYLQQNGWQRDLPWGFHVALPEGLKVRTGMASLAEWAGAGVKLSGGKGLPAGGAQPYTLFFPEGHEGPAFLMSANYEALKSYNFSDLYFFSVASLAEQIAGRRPSFANAWIGAKPLSKRDRVAMQEKLAALGYTPPSFDGRISLAMREVLARYQSDNGLIADGHPDAELLAHIMQK